MGFVGMQLQLIGVNPLPHFHPPPLPADGG